jgi:hypothetical protein
MTEELNILEKSIKDNYFLFETDSIDFNDNNKIPINNISNDKDVIDIN